MLRSAVANAEHNANLPADELVVVRAWVDEGPTLKRFRPRALGRATRVRKRTCHISIVVGRVEAPLEAVGRGRRDAGGGRSARRRAAPAAAPPTRARQGASSEEDSS